jgi:hypothetical protein
MDSMPFLHANRTFTLTFFEDLAFVDVRAILDELIARHAFDPRVQETASMYVITRESASFNVWTADHDVIIRRT